MTGRMNLIVIGNGDYENPCWPALTHVPPHNARLAEYVRQQWPGSRIITEGADRAWPAADLRAKLRDWLECSGKDDDVLLLWSGHGLGKNGKHRLITWDSPDPDQVSITSENAIATSELADYLVGCPARRIVILLNTCWSGDGGHELAALIGDAMNETLTARQKRSMVIISSARREEARDGAFVSSILNVLSRPGPPSGLGQEHQWARSDSAIDPVQLVAAVNRLLEDSNHQAQLSVPYGTVGAFFRRLRTPVAAQLPPSVVSRLLADFPGSLPAGAGPWDIAKLRAAISEHGNGELTDELSYRLDRLALSLAALTFLEGWLGSGSGLANRLGPAWRSVLRPIHRIPHPVERFGFIEQIALHGTAGQVVEFVARVIRDAGDNPCDDRLYQWAEDELRVDRQVVDDALSRISAPLPQSRLIINFGMTIADDEEQDALPKSVIAWLYRPDEPPRPPHEVPFDPPDVAEIVGRMVAWARAEAGEISQVDVALPVSLFCADSRPEAASLRLHGRLRRPVAASSGIVIRWSDRILNAGLRAEGLAQGRSIASGAGALAWVDADTYADGQALYDALESHARAVAFSFKPSDPEFFYAAIFNSPYVVWPDADIANIRGEITARWQDLPRRLAEAYSSSAPKPDAMRSMHAVWDDPDWLENIVPSLIAPQHRLTV